MSEFIEVGDPQILCPICRGNNIMLTKIDSEFYYSCKCGHEWEAMKDE
jgi:hypothetical protein